MHSLGIGGIALNDTEAAVTTKLGAPLRKSEYADYIHTRYQYRGIRIGFAFDSVAEIESDDPLRCTDQGLCPGASVAKMKRIYGTPKIMSREHGVFLEYLPAEGNCWYQFSAVREQIRTVGIVCQP